MQAELEALRKQRDEIDARIEELEARAEAEERAGGDVVEVRSRSTGCYVLQKVRCGKPTCRCAKGGEGHGPYWYHYFKENGKTRCKYVGKTLPASD